MKLNNKFEIFIVTYNRENLLKDTINSLLNQTVNNIKITVFDNGSTDGTENYIKSVMEKHKNIFYRKNEKNNPKLFQQITNFVESEYVMFFHDDDLLHPQYVEYVLKLLDKYNNVDMILSPLTAFYNNQTIPFKQYNKVKYSIYKGKKNFVKHAYSQVFCGKYAIIFPNIVYKTANLNKATDYYGIYGKIFDKIFAIDTVSDGLAIQFDSSFLHYRIHSNQDTNNKSSAISINNIANYNKFFKNILSKDLFSKLIYNLYTILWLNDLYCWAKSDTFPDIKEYAEYMYKNGASNRFARIFYNNKPVIIILRTIIKIRNLFNGYLPNIKTLK